MIAVADTSPVCYLILIGEIDLLPKLLLQSTLANIVLLDEKAARRVAATRGLRVTGILGVLGEAATRGLLDLASAIDRLRMTSFRASPALLKTTLDRFATR
jgi:predicted nucleic acid-binding protein